MPLSAASCEQGASPSLSQGCRNMTPLSIAQVTCLSVDIVTIYMLRNANSALLFSLILSNSPHFFELHYWALHGDRFISLSCPVFALLNNIVCSFHTRCYFCVLYPVDVPHRVGTHPGHAYSCRVPAAAGFTTHNMAGPSNTGSCNFFQVAGHISNLNGARGQIMTHIGPNKLMKDKRNVGFSVHKMCAGDMACAM